VSLASAAHHSGLDARLVGGHVRELYGGARVVPAPVSAERTAPVLELLAPLWERADLDGEFVIADVGRQLNLTAGRELLARADVVLLVSGGSAAALAHTRDAMRSLEGRVKVLMVVVSGPGAHSGAEIAAALEARVVVLPWDEASAAMLRGEPQPKRNRRDRRAYALLQQIVPLGDALLRLLPEPPSARKVLPPVEPSGEPISLAESLRHGDCAGPAWQPPGVPEHGGVR
jgi:hypothetical protein